MGRPSIYTPELLTTICERLSKGEPLAAICREDGMPDPSTVWDWQKADTAISQAIARAREQGEDAIALQALEIIDSPPAMVSTKYGEQVDSGDVALRRVRFEGRLKLLAKWNPKRWGDKLELAGNAEQPLQVVIQRKSGEPSGDPA